MMKHYLVYILAIFSVIALNVPSLAQEEAASLLPVDCLLPGQVRKLGRITTFITPRSPVKTTAIDCEIRGGEYVAYDRADYKTALKIWLAAAEGGDSQAQLYVAHIYEKGLGTRPNYDKAALWYKKSSDAGNVQAMLGLAQLYEKGLGVTQDLAAAQTLYSTAMGEPGLVSMDPVSLNDGSFTLSETDYKSLVSLLGGQADKSYTLVELARLHAAEKSSLELSLSRAKDSITEQGSRIAKERAYSGKLEDDLKESSKNLNIVTRRLDEEASTIRSLEQSLKKPGKLLKKQEAKIAKLEKQIAASQIEKAVLEADLIETKEGEKENKKIRKQLKSAEKALAKENVKLDKEKAKQNQLKTKFDSKTREIDQLRKLSRDQEKQLAMLKRQIEEPRVKIAKQAAIIEALEEKVELSNLEAEKFKKELSNKEAAAKKLALESMAGPTLSMIEPKLQLTRGIAVVAVSRDITSRQVTGRVDAPLGLMTLTVNGESQQVNERGIFSTSVPLKAVKTNVEIIAIDTTGKESRVDFELSAGQDLSASNSTQSPKPAQDEGPRFGNYYALIIGNSKYQYLPDLKTPKNDVMDVAKILEDNYGFQNTILLDVGRNEIISAMNEFRKTLTSDDNFLIYYAGHGGLDEVNNRGHWLPTDAEPDNPANWLNNTVVTDFLNLTNAKQILVVADSCYSGSLTRSALMNLQGGMTEQEYKKYLSVLSRKKARTALTSGGLKPVLDAGGGKHSIFSQALLESLDNNKEILEGQRLYREVLARVSNRASNINFEQEPEYAPINFSGHEGGDFLFVPTAR